jgi:hypothetical protein
MNTPTRGVASFSAREPHGSNPEPPTNSAVFPALNLVRFFECTLKTLRHTGAPSSQIGVTDSVFKFWMSWDVHSQSGQALLRSSRRVAAVAFAPNVIAYRS